MQVDEEKLTKHVPKTILAFDWTTGEVICTDESLLKSLERSIDKCLKYRFGFASNNWRKMHNKPMRRRLT